MVIEEELDNIQQQVENFRFLPSVPSEQPPEEHTKPPPLQIDPCKAYFYELSLRQQYQVLSQADTKQMMVQDVKIQDGDLPCKLTKMDSKSIMDVHGLDPRLDSQRYSRTVEYDKNKGRRATKEQVRVLEQVFSLDPLPSTATKKVIAERLGMSLQKVQIWFQNRRAKQRRINRRYLLNNQEEEGPYKSWTI